MADITDIEVREIAGGALALTSNSGKYLSAPGHPSQLVCENATVHRALKIGGTGNNNYRITAKITDTGETINVRLAFLGEAMGIYDFQRV